MFTKVHSRTTRAPVAVGGMVLYGTYATYGMVWPAVGPATNEGTVAARTVHKPCDPYRCAPSLPHTRAAPQHTTDPSTMVWYGMVEVYEGAPVAVSGWVLTDRHDLRLCAASSLHRGTISVSNVMGNCPPKVKTTKSNF